MRRYLSPGRPPQSRSHSHGPDSPRRGRDKDIKPELTLHVPNFGLIIIPTPEAPDQDGNTSGEPREDHMLHGELEVFIRGAPRRCKAIRAGFRTVIKLDMGRERKIEEDTLFERKVELTGASDDGILLQPGSQRFDFTIILPANLAPHDWHPNGTIQHYLYAELEGQPAPEHEFHLRSLGSSSSLFSFRQGSKRGNGTAASSRAPSRGPSRPGSRSTSRAPSPTRRAISGGPNSAGPSSAHTAPVSGTTTPFGLGTAAHPQALGAALAELNLNANGTASPRATVTPPSGHVNPAYLYAAQSMSMSRQEEAPIPRTPSYENAMAAGRDGSTPATPTSPQTSPAEWLQGITRVERKCMLVYNPDLSGGASGFDDNTSGFIKGLGVWDLSMMSDIWSISALMGIKIKITSIPATTTVFSARLLLGQTCDIISPRDPEDSDKKMTSTRNFPIAEAGKRPPSGHTHPDKHYPALWRGTGVPGGKDLPVPGSDGGEVIIDTHGRLPSDDVGRPSTLPGVVTPITVTHHVILEVYFSVWSETDRGEAMKITGPGGLRMLRVSRPVSIPSCTLLPQVVGLPSYDDHQKDPVANETLNSLPEDSKDIFGWATCACGQKLEDMEKRMKAATVAERSGQSLAGIVAAAAAADKNAADQRRGRQPRGSV